MKRNDLISIFLFVVIVAAAALFGSLSTSDAASKYGELEQPPWAPPPGLFGIAWSILYVCIGVAGWLIWRAERWSLNTGLWGVQMAMNALWSPLFFAFDWFGFALAWIIALDVVVAALIWRKRTTPMVAWLLAPYLAWILFASALNGAIWQLNP